MCVKRRLHTSVWCGTVGSLGQKDICECRFDIVEVRVAFHVGGTYIATWPGPDGAVPTLVVALTSRNRDLLG